ncbi:hypothetical protein [Pedobacter sp. SL55]|uniref:hypothetical protein n=1 Tax=Pedobacter sp. SL55 TaxID=2995161 RepID=UPI0022713CB8|nr:hypothetical protein [Pedobacter sp. SL55]WAC39101.1 hypothetical protein OVA16_10795 [Pedobacter sp. SL55]
MKKLKINLFGEGIGIEKLVIKNQNNFKQFSSYQTNDFNEAMQSPPYLDLVNNLPTHTLLRGLLNTYKNQIEIWFAGKKAIKLKMADLNADYLLFPLYQYQMDETPLNFESGIYCKTQEIGLIASYETYLNSLDIDKLVFQISILENQTLLSGFTYDNQKISVNKTDTLITNRIYFKGYH